MKENKGDMFIMDYKDQNGIKSVEIIRNLTKNILKN